MAKHIRTQLACLIVDALQNPVIIDGQELLLPYAQLGTAREIAVLLTEQEGEAREARLAAVLAEYKPHTLPCLASRNTFSVLLVKLPM